MNTDKSNDIMRSVMKTAQKILRERPGLGINPELPLIRHERPEWFEEKKDALTRVQ